MRTPARHRRAELAQPSSDLTRGRAWLLAALLGAVASGALLVVRDGPRSLAAPGPLARPHRDVACASCHGQPGTVAAACTSCHGPHPSARAPHRTLAASGGLGCPTCHAVHRAEAGVRFETDGSTLWYGTGIERRLPDERGAAQNTGFGASAVNVPLVSRGACERCHDLDRDSDPAAHCTADHVPWTLCFDEHRGPGAASAAQPAARDAVVGRARELARSPALAATSVASGMSSDAACIAAGLGVAVLVVTLGRRRRRPPRVLVSAPAPGGARRLPVIDAARCLGCHACVDACPYDALVIERYSAVLARPEACCGAGPCQDSCPNGSLRLALGTTAAPGPALSNELESLGARGIFLAGDVTGGSLVRHALRQGVVAARAAAARVARSSPGGRRGGAGDVEFVIVGAGPAGLAAALTARELGLRTVVLEQAELAASIRSFSRDKLVLDAPPADDERLPLFIGDLPKEELVQRWQRTVRRARLDVREGARVVAVVPGKNQGFVVRAELGGGALVELSAAVVLLATGTRGTPRELEAPVAPEARPNVHYELSDARAFAGRRVLVVGLGDVAMESALALAAQPGTEVTVLHRGAGFRRGKQRNIDALSTLVATGKVRLVLGASVERVGVRALTARVGGSTRSFDYGALFVHVGRVPSRELLIGAGIFPPFAASPHGFEAPARAGIAAADATH